jgi:hypothetical protein
MRLSAWRARAPHRDSMNPKVVSVIEPVLVSLGADADPECWVAWGEDPATRYTVLVISQAGLFVTHVRVNVAQEGPRAAGKLVRWNRVQTGELGIEMQGGHRLLSFQVEGQILRAVDDETALVTAFALDVFAAIDGRALPSAARGAARAGRPGKASTGGAATRPSEAAAGRIGAGTGAGKAAVAPARPRAGGR